ncbi:MAG: diaminopimelate decarboxylase, partial [Blastopirellula sp.]|nr:diaminopimelate decarboxylase [Blastopirellula sp.]
MVDAAAFPSIRHEIAGVSIAALAEQYGTPVYAYDAATILQRVRDLQA